jgi:ABC-type uncharacterized transport system permease subunit
VVSDNASNNGAMMKELGMYGMKRLNRTKARVHCVLHVLNLVSQVCLLIHYLFYNSYLHLII